MHSSIIIICVSSIGVEANRGRGGNWKRLYAQDEQLSCIKGSILYVCVCVFIRDNRQSQWRCAFWMKLTLNHVHLTQSSLVCVLLSECDRIERGRGKKQFIEYFLGSFFFAVRSFIKPEMSVRVLLSYSLKSFIK